MGCGASSKKNYQTVEDESRPANVPNGPTNPEPLKTNPGPPRSKTGSLRSAKPTEPQVVGGGHVICNESDQRMWEHYIMDTSTTIGQGSYGPVRKVTNMKTQNVRACKILRKEKVQRLEAMEEVEVMKTLDHPNICRMFEVFEDFANFYLIIELCEGGSLMDYMAVDEGFNEYEASAIMQQVFRCVNYMHGLNVCHRDIKPENLLFLKKEVLSNATLKLIDFGAARRFYKGEVLNTTIGTRDYMAPEVEDGHYNHLCDMWSCGCVMYLMLCGRPPFDKHVARSEKKPKPGDWASATPDAKDLLSRLLATDFKKRITAQQAVEHPWVKKMAPRTGTTSLSGNQVNGLRNYASQNQLKKGALQVIAQRLSEKDILALKQTFLVLDKNQDGVVTYAELREGIAQLGMRSIPNDLKEMMNNMDTNGSATIDYTEFLAATLSTKKTTEEDVCWAAFRAFDLDGSGKICRKELGQVLNSKTGIKDMASPEALARVLQECDNDGDAEIDFQEFMTMMRAV